MTASHSSFIEVPSTGLQVCVCVTDRATDTINELRRVLDREPVIVSSMTGEQCRETAAELVQHADHSYGTAGHRLRRLLSHASVPSLPPTKTVLFAEPSRVIFSVSFML